MKRFFTKIKRKESPQPPRQPIPPAKPTDIAAGPPDSQEELDVIPDEGRNLFNEGLEPDRTDPTAQLDEGGGEGSQVLIQDGTGGVRELPASGASTSRTAIGGTGCASEWFRFPQWAQHSRGPVCLFLLAEGPGNAGGEETEPAEISTSM